MGPLASVRSYNRRLTGWAEGHPVRWCALMVAFGTAAILLPLSAIFGGPIGENLGYALAFGVFFGVLQALFLRTIET
ncbi:hypothetical protein [Haladaptatus sp. CMAA 1911]|uniref:hypothetical protein n=1 Tax=unclassified Haladaptatus TaxID=2622732 RepID=UPI0037543975